MKIKNIRIKNLYSYEDASFSFGNYNVIVGRNASGKTNLIRILKLLTKPSAPSSGLPSLSLTGISNELRFNKNSECSINMRVEFSESEVNLLLDSVSRKDTPPEELKSYYKDYGTSTLIVYWKPTVDTAEVLPAFVALWFDNGIILYFSRGEGTYIAYQGMLPQPISGEDPGKALELLNGSSVGEFPTMQKNDPSLTLNFSTTRIKTLFEQSHCSRFHIDELIYLTNRDKQYVMNAIKELSRYSFTGHPSFWTLLAVMLENRLCFISEHRPSLEELANNLFDLKNKEPLAENYDKLKQDFQKIFQSIEFDVYEEETSAPTGKKRYVVIKEDSKRVRLHESASGYFEALYMLSLISAPEHPILILDEPALHLHPTKITLLSKILMDKKDVQTIIVTHSPYFVDFSLLQGTQDRRLIYVRKDDNESTVIAPTNGFAIQRHEFQPEVFFSNSVLLVEGPADHATVIAISELKENILDQNDVTVVDVGGKENFKKWIKLLRKYEIPFIILADHDVELGDLVDQNVCIKLDRELEDEIEKLGWERQEGEKIHPNEAYDFIKNLQEDKKEELFKSKIWEAVERTVKLAGG